MKARSHSGDGYAQNIVSGTYKHQVAKLCRDITCLGQLLVIGIIIDSQLFANLANHRSNLSGINISTQLTLKCFDKKVQLLRFIGIYSCLAVWAW